MMDRLVTTHRFLWRHGLAPARKDFHPIGRVRGYVRFWRDWRRYRQLPGAESLRLRDTFPQLEDDTGATAVESHYFYQSVWLSNRLGVIRPDLHVDIGSDHRMVGMLTGISKVIFAEIRPLEARIKRLVQVTASIVDLPFRSDSIRSLSCLHVAEHVGLGRYGDRMDPLGSQRSAHEVSRVLAPGGDLFFSLPVGRARVEFNAHRIHTPLQVIAMFPELELREFCVEDDRGRYVESAEPRSYAHASYACGMFWFRKTARRP